MSYSFKRWEEHFFRLEYFKMDAIVALQEWFALNCDGDWEHSYGIKMETLDNPGWALRIDLTETALDDKPFDSIKIERTEDNWVFCKIENHIFTGFGGIRNLTELVQLFVDWTRSV